MFSKVKSIYAKKVKQFNQYAMLHTLKLHE